MLEHKNRIHELMEKRRKYQTVDNNRISYRRGAHHSTGSFICPAIHLNPQDQNQKGVNTQKDCWHLPVDYKCTRIPLIPVAFKHPSEIETDRCCSYLLTQCSGNWRTGTIRYYSLVHILVIHQLQL